MGARKYFRGNTTPQTPAAEGDGTTRIIRCGYKRDGCSFWKIGENIYWGAGLYSQPRVVMCVDDSFFFFFTVG